MRGIFQTPIFPQTMSRSRFQLIQRYLHFSDNNVAGTNEDPLYKIRTILDTVVNNFRTNYTQDRGISVDEVTRGWRVACDFVCITQAKSPSGASFVKESSNVIWLTPQKFAFPLNCSYCVKLYPPVSSQCSRRICNNRSHVSEMQMLRTDTQGQSNMALLKYTFFKLPSPLSQAFYCL